MSGVRRGRGDPIVDRRSFLGAVASGLSAAPWAAVGQQPNRMPRLGILRLSPPRASYENAFVEALKDEGYVVGRNLAIDDRHADGNPQRLPALAIELTRVPVTAIFARGVQALAAAKQATSTIPIVAFDDVTDPVQGGYVTSLAHPDGNVTGVFVDLPELAGKWLELLTEVVPRLARVAVLWDPSTGTLQRDAVQSAARALGKELQLLEVEDALGFEKAFAIARRASSDAILVMSSPLMRINGKRIAEFALQARLAAVAPYRDFPEVGGLMSYGPYLPAWFRRCGVQLAKIFRGAQPGELPIERPDRFELIVNAQTVKALRMTIPQSLLVRADEVVN